MNNTGNITPHAITDDLEYTQSSLTSCPPLLGLQAYGICCPFLETEEEHDARTGIHNLQSYPITWYRKKRLRDVAKDVAGNVKRTNRPAANFIDGIVANVDKFLGASMRGADDDAGYIPMTYVGVPATLTVVDTDEHGPILRVQAVEDGGDGHGREQSLDGKHDCELPYKIIPLSAVDTIGTGWSLINDPTAGGIKLFGFPQSNSMFGGSGEELLRFDTLGGGGNVMSDTLFPVKAEEPNKYSDKVICQLRSLVEWNRRRIANDVKRGRVRVAQTSAMSYVTKSET
ncbi:hypothetical protein ACHAWX_004288 [Stephanocyclus meneghinianus]